MCWQPGDLCTVERAKGTQRQGDGNSAGGVFCARCSSFFWEALSSSEQPLTSTLQGPAEAHPGLGVVGREHKGLFGFFGLHLLPCLQKKSKIFFCFGGCLPLPGKPWLVGRTFPGTDFTADLIAVAISQHGLSGYAFPPAVPWLGCSKECLLPLHSCACTHL